MQQQQLGGEGTGGGAASGGVPAQQVGTPYWNPNPNPNPDPNPNPNPNPNPQQVGTPCGDAHPDVRLGMIIPWVGPIPLWTSYFVSSARLSSPIADFLIFHEGQVEAQHHTVQYMVHYTVQYMVHYTVHCIVHCMVHFIVHCIVPFMVHHIVHCIVHSIVDYTVQTSCIA